MDSDAHAALAELLRYFETTDARMMPFRRGRGKRQANAEDVREHAADKIRAFGDAHGIW